MTDQSEAIEQMEQSVASLEDAQNKLSAAERSATSTEQRKIVALRTHVSAQLALTRTLVRDLRAASVVVTRPPADAYASLQSAIAELQAIEVESGGVSRLLTVVAALGTSVESSRSDISSRSA